MARTPADTAREAIRLLAQRRQPPTPELYWHAYHEIAGEADTIPEQALVETLNRKIPGEKMAVRKALEQAALARDWEKYSGALFEQLEIQAANAGWTQTWGELIRELIKQYELRQTGLNTQRKQEMLQRVLMNFGNAPRQLNEKLVGLIRAWRENSVADDTPALEAADVVAEDASAPPESASPTTGAADADDLWKEARQLICDALALGLVPRLAGWPELQSEASDLLQAIRNEVWPQHFPAARNRLRKFWLRLEVQMDYEDRLILGINNILRLLVENLAEFSSHDEWTCGQYAAVQQILNEPPSMQVVYQAELSLKALVFRQAAIKHSLDEAQEQIKRLIGTFIDRLGTMSESTGHYHDRIKDYSARIRSAQNIAELTSVVDGLMDDTRAIQLDMQRSRDDLKQAHDEVEQAQQRVRELEQELATVSEKVREDQLTGALNRRGLDDALERELARAARKREQLCLAVIDLDDFKKLNDQRGHLAGDQALQHLVRVVKETLRPTDVIARYGGEEFVVLLPHTEMEEAVQVLQRLQRELTRRYFLHNNERVLITFSAGVTAFQAEDNEISAIARADAAMYRAKKAGKNRVEAG